MGDTWIANMKCFLDDSGALPADMPGPAMSLVRHLGAIVAASTAAGCVRGIETPVPCRRRPGRRWCTGFILAGFDDEQQAIVWKCPACGDQGSITGWEGTSWDRRPHRSGAQ